MITNDQKKIIRELRDRNYSFAKIAKELNLSLSTVFRHSSKNQDLCCSHCGGIILNGKALIAKIKQKTFDSVMSDSDLEKLKKEKEEISRLLANTLVS